MRSDVTTQFAEAWLRLRVVGALFVQAPYEELAKEHI